jgi:hypothetical protein
MSKTPARESALAVAVAEILYSDMATPLGVATLLLFVVCFLDVLTTSLIISRGGYEINPLMVPIVAVPQIHMIFKWLFVTFVAGIAAISERTFPRAGLLMMGVIIFWYIIVVIHNVIVMVSILLL